MVETMGDLATRLDHIRRSIASAARRVGRSADEITLIGASKRQPLERMRAAHAAGLRVFGENRVQEGEAKRAHLPEQIEWHMLGPLQSNKVKRSLATFSVFHAVDRAKIARRLERHAAELGTEVVGFLEVNLGAEASKHGFPPADLAEAVSEFAAFRHLRVVGLMAIPPYEEEPEASRGWFRRLRRLRDELGDRPEWQGWPGWLSMGMSHDFKVAVEEGATHVRIGTALFGERPE